MLTSISSAASSIWVLRCVQYDWYRVGEVALKNYNDSKVSSRTNWPPNLRTQSCHNQKGDIYSRIWIWSSAPGYYGSRGGGGRILHSEFNKAFIRETSWDELSSPRLKQIALSSYPSFKFKIWSWSDQCLLGYFTITILRLSSNLGRFNWWSSSFYAFVNFVMLT